MLFLASSSEFDQQLVEDPTANRLRESRTIFDTIVNHSAFSSISFILFLNKMDLLQGEQEIGSLQPNLTVREINLPRLRCVSDKVERRRVSVATYFPDEFASTSDVRSHVEKFGGDPFDVAEVKAFILYRFASARRSNSEPLYHHFTTAVDTRNIQYVFGSVKETILRRNLDRLMLQ